MVYPSATRRLGTAARTTKIRQELNLKVPPSPDQPSSRGMTAQASPATAMLPTLRLKQS